MVTPAQIAQNYASALDSVTLINQLISLPKVTTTQADRIGANKAHLSTMLAQTYWTTENLTPFTQAVALPIPTVDDTPVPVSLASLKANKNQQINHWRAEANATSFPHLGKDVACDDLSRSDIDAVAGSVALNGVFPAGFPGAWKAMDNNYIMLPDIAAFKALYGSMTLQGTINFGRSQQLKAALAAATTAAQVTEIAWA